MIEFLVPWLLSHLLAFTVLVGIATLVEVLPLRMTAAHRSWMWRAVYLKTLLWMLCPSWMLAPWDATLSTCVPVSIPQVASEWMLVNASPARSATSLAANAPLDGRLSDVSHSPSWLNRQSTASSQWVSTHAESVASMEWVWMKLGAAWYFLFLWLAGIGLLACIMIGRTWRMHRLLVRSTRLVPSHLLAMSASTAKQMGVRKPSRVELSSEIQGPMLILSHRVHLVLPEDFESKFGAEGCRMAIAHELAHYKRRDLWWNVLPTAVSVLFFFWPPAWMAARRYYLAMEMACDHCAIRYAHLGWLAYAELLVRLLEDKQRRPMGAVALSMAWSGSFRALSERIRYMKIDLQSMRYRSPLSTAILGAAVVLISLPWALADDGGKKKKTSAGRSRNPHQSSVAESLPNEPAQAPPPANVASGFASGSSSGFGASAGGGGGGTFGKSDRQEGGSRFGGGSAMAGGSASVSGGVSIDSHPSSAPPASPGERQERGGFGSNNIPLFGGMASGSTFGSSTNLGSASHSVERSREMHDGELVAQTRVQTDDVTVTIEESDAQGILVTVREMVRGKEKTKKYKAKNIETLAKKYPAAMDWVRKYHSDSNGVETTLGPSSDSIPRAPVPGQFGSSFGTGFGTHSDAQQNGGIRGGSWGSSTRSGSGFSGGFGTTRNGTGGVQMGASGGGGTAPGPNAATELMLQHLEKNMSETENPVLREQFRTMIDAIRSSKR